MKYVLYFITSITCSTALGMQPSESATQAAAAAQPMMTLQLVDASVQTPRALLDESETLHHMLEYIPNTENKPIPLAIHMPVTTDDWKNVIQPTLEKIQRSKNNKLPLDPGALDPIVKTIETTDVQKTIQIYGRIIESADYLEIKPLVENAIKHVAFYMKNNYTTFLQHPEYFSSLNNLAAHLQQRISNYLFFELPKLDETNAPVTAVALNATGTTLAYGSLQQALQILDLSLPKARSTNYGYNGKASKIVMTPTKNILVTDTANFLTGDYQLKLWDLSDSVEGPLLKDTYRVFGHNDFIVALAINSNGTLLASASKDDTLKIWRISDFKPQLQITAVPHVGHDYWIDALAMNARGNLLAMARNDNTIQLLDLSQINNLLFIAISEAHTDNIKALAVNAAGTILASGSDDNTIKLWDISQLDDPQLRATLDATRGGHTDMVKALAMNAEGTILVSGSYDGTIKLWDISQPNNPQVRATIDTKKNDQQNRINALAINADVTVLAAGSEDSGVMVWYIPWSKPLVEASLLFYSIEQHYRDTSEKLVLNTILQKIYTKLTDKEKAKVGHLIIHPATTSPEKSSSKKARTQ